MNNFEKTLNQVIDDNNISTSWSKNVIDQSLSLKNRFNQNRKDLKNEHFVTIDGEDAKDFDDAVYCEKSKSTFKLKVAIADVSELIAENSYLDKEALNRGTSIYFPSKVIPMFPEKISNDLCSLKPNEARNVLVCEMIFDLKGEMLSYVFFEGVIESKKRMTYNEVEKILLEEHNFQDENIFNSLNSLRSLVKKLLAKRSKRNALEIENVEPVLKFNQDGDFEKIYEPKRFFSHKMIEESMIAANICASQYVEKYYGFSIYRVHENPEHLKLESLKNFFSLKGFSSKKFHDPLELITSLIGHSRNSELKKVMQVLILQSMKRAEYSTKKIGHFGLQLESYSHFTSPIRRYPDLILHRMIKKILRGNIFDINQEELESDLNDLSSLERKAESASRQFIQQLVCYQLREFIGDDFDTHVAGIADFGLFCEIENFYISGLIHVSDLKKDRYIFDKQANLLKGKRTGRTFRIGQKIRVKLVNVFPEERKIVLIPQ